MFDCWAQRFNLTSVSTEDLYVSNISTDYGSFGASDYPWTRIGYNISSLICVVTRPSRCTESSDRQVAPSVTCCRLCGLRYPQVRPRLIAAPPLRASLATCVWTCGVQTCGHDVYGWLHGQAPQYLMDLRQPVFDVSSTQHLRSATRHGLFNIFGPLLSRWSAHRSGTYCQTVCEIRL